jgi:hypothetical protein
MSQLIDITAAKEFMKETLDRVSREELIAIASDLEVKSAFFQQLLHPENIDQLSASGLEEIFRKIFATRRHFRKITEAQPLEKLSGEIKNLLYGEDKIEDRFTHFIHSIEGVDVGMKADLAGEILHFTQPDLYWMWSRWMWDPNKKTGAIPLVTTEGFDLEGEHHGEVYMKVGKGVAFVHSVGEAADFQFISRSLFGTDVFLSCVYVVYAYTVLRMRMTQEFNKVMPGLPEFTRRLLGVHKLPQAVE